MKNDRFKELAAQAADECLKALLDDAKLETGVFLENWAEEHDIPLNQMVDFVDAARAQLVTQVAFCSLADKATPLSDMPLGLDSEEYTRSRTYSLYSRVSAMFEPRDGERHKEWEECRSHPCAS